MPGANVAPPGHYMLFLIDGADVPSVAAIVSAAACPTITLSPSSLPSGTVGAGYTQTITQRGGSGAATFAVTTGALPAG